jgi:hypothetical protein
MAFIAAVFSFTACAGNEQLITFAQLPAAAQTIVQDNFDVNNVAYVKMERDFIGKEYEVRFNDGTEIDFEGDGSLKKVDCHLLAVPEALVPAPVLNYVKTMFPQAFVTEWGKDDWGWKAELNNKLEIKFNRKYEAVGLDD